MSTHTEPQQPRNWHRQSYVTNYLVKKMNQKLENNQPGLVIENPPGTSDIDVNSIETPAQDLKHPDVDNGHITAQGKTISDEMLGMIDKVLASLNDYEITVEDKKQILKGAIERLN